MAIRQHWRNEVGSDMDAIKTKMRDEGRKWTWLHGKLKERGVVITQQALYDYVAGRYLASQEFIETTKTILGMDTERKVG